MMQISSFHVLFTTTDFVFCKSGVLLFMHYQDTVSYYILVSGTLCLNKYSKDVQHCVTRGPLNVLSSIKVIQLKGLTGQSVMQTFR